MNLGPAKGPTIAISAGYGNDSLRGGKNDCLLVGDFGNNPPIVDFGIKAYKGKMKAHVSTYNGCCYSRAEVRA